MRASLVFVLILVVLLGCGSSANHDLGEAFTLEGWATVNDKGQCTTQLVGYVGFACVRVRDEDNDRGRSLLIPVAPCVVVSTTMQKQKILLRTLHREFRIPGAMVKAPRFSSPLPGVLDATGSTGGGDDSDDSDQQSLGFAFQERFLADDQQNDDEKKGRTVARASIPADSVPSEFLQWVILNQAFIPFPMGNIEAVYQVDGRTSPAGDIISTNKVYYVGKVDAAFTCR